MQYKSAAETHCPKLEQTFSLWAILAVITLPFMDMSAARAQDVSSFLIAKGQSLFQSGSELPALVTNEGPFVFVAFVEPGAANSVRSAILWLPGGSARILTNQFGEFQVEERFPTRRSLDTSFEAGGYTFVIDAANDGARRLSLNMRTNSFPSTPHILNWEAAQNIDAAAAFTLVWNSFAGGSSNDFIHLLIENEAHATVFESPGFAEQDALDGTKTSLIIPGGMLAANQLYHGRLLFVNRTALNTNDYPEVTGLSGYFKETFFDLVTAAPSPPQGRLQFDASFYDADEISGAAIIQVIRTGGSSGQVSVDVAAASDTAGSYDYASSSGTLTFAPGETSKAFAVNVWDDWALEGREYIQLSLSNPTGGAILGTPGNAVITILDNERSAAGGLQFSLARYVVNETNRAAIITITRSGRASGHITVDFSTSDGTANDGWDYTNRLMVVKFAPGQISRNVTVPIANDTIDENNETVLLYLSNPSGGASLGSRNTAELVIKDNDAGGVLNFQTASFSMTETGAYATVVVTRTRGNASGVTVDYSVNDETATAGLDYMTVSGTLTFDADESSKSFIVPFLDDDLPEGDETVSLTLANPTGGARLGALSNAVVNILDDELALQFSRVSYTINETGRVATITVLRSGPTNNAVSVDYFTADNTAIAGADYGSRSGTLVIPAGTRRKAFTIPVINDTLDEDAETVNLSLHNAVGTNAFLGPRTNAALTILDDDVGGIINFRFAGYQTNEGAGQALVAVRRAGGAAGGVTVSFATSDGSALAGTHYVSTQGTVSFGPGQTIKMFAVPLLNNTIDEIDRTVFLTLRDPTGGAVLGSLTNAVLTIRDDDPPSTASAAASPTR